MTVHLCKTPKWKCFCFWHLHSLPKSHLTTIEHLFLLTCTGIIAGLQFRTLAGPRFLKTAKKKSHPLFNLIAVFKWDRRFYNTIISIINILIFFFQQSEIVFHDLTLMYKSHRLIYIPFWQSTIDVHRILNVYRTLHTYIV